jgi:hypothetical protein
MLRKKIKCSTTQAVLINSVNEPVQEILKKIGINYKMSKTVMVQSVRTYLDNQSNPVRTCNAILFKLGVPVQFNTEVRKSRIYALTALDEAIVQGEDFDPCTVIHHAEMRLAKIEKILGKDSSVYEEKETKISSNAQIAREIYASMSDKKTGDIVNQISLRLGIEKQKAYSLFYGAKKALTV